MRKENDCQWSSPSIQQKIEQAHCLYSDCGGLLKQDPSIHTLLNKLQNCLENTQESMLKFGVVAECKLCEEKEGGSCCGTGIENKYDVVLLLINLLLGAPLPIQGQRENSCYFLGEQGCTLAARHVLCVNYICNKLQKKLTRNALLRLQECVGDELEAEFVLHEAIKKQLRAAP